MPYMESIVLEMLRLAMGRTINIPHRALRDGTIQGYHVPKNTILLVNFHHLLMSSTYWDEPELFKPERFINADNKVTIPDIFKPFGFGLYKVSYVCVVKSFCEWLNGIYIW
nr:PREDICTED: probable cytochrome P450 303a1 [Bemisia tabaci]